jgi:dihydroneopterin aldolase
VASSRLSLSGIRASGRHGANPGEQLEAQEFVVDLDVTLDTGGDSLDDTIDYRALVDAAREVVEMTSFQLLESLADAVARAVYQWSNVSRVTAVVHKPRAASSMGVDDVAAEATVS